MKLARSIILILLCAAFVPSVVSADPLNYKVEGETVTVVACDENASGDWKQRHQHWGSMPSMTVAD